MTLQAPKRRARCRLTGTPIAPGAALYAQSEPQHRGKRPYLQAEGEMVSAPQTLHRRAQEGAVGLAYAVMMARYLELAVAEQKSALSLAERLALIAWWDSAYGVRRVRRGLCERLSEADADQVLLAVIACHREQADPDEIGPRYGHDGDWMRDRIDYCMRLANRRSRVATA